MEVVTLSGNVKVDNGNVYDGINSYEGEKTFSRKRFVEALENYMLKEEEESPEKIPRKEMKKAK